MLPSMRDIKREQKEELHIIFLTELEINKNNATLKTILIHIEYNGQMPHQNLNQLPNIFIEMFTIHIIFCPIAMSFVSIPSPSKDNQSSLGTDLDIINTEDEMHIDTTNWTPTKWKKLQHMTEFHEEYQRIFGEKASICTIMKKENLTHESPYA